MKLSNSHKKQIKVLAGRLPANAISARGREIEVLDSKGETIGNHVINHERRMRKAYETHGESGYLIYYAGFIKPSPHKLEVWQLISQLTGLLLPAEFVQAIKGETPTESEKENAEIQESSDGNASE